jgi:hypothetical protein
MTSNCEYGEVPWPDVPVGSQTLVYQTPQVTQDFYIAGQPTQTANTIRVRICDMNVQEPPITSPDIAFSFLTIKP